MAALASSSTDGNTGSLVSPPVVKVTLLTLPTEIRMMVYELLYPPGVPTVKPNMKDDPTDIQQPAALITTCSKIYYEAGPIMYRNIFMTAHDTQNDILSNNPFAKHAENVTIKLHPENPPTSLSQAQRCLAKGELPSLKACTFIAPVCIRFFQIDGRMLQVPIWTLLKHLVRLQPHFDEDLMAKVESATVVLNFVTDRDNVMGEVNYPFNIKRDVLGREHVEQLYDAACKAHIEGVQKFKTTEQDIFALLDIDGFVINTLEHFKTTTLASE